MKREPIFGSNAKAFFIQAAVGIAVVLLLNYFARPWLTEMARTYINW